jgi:hypothetical protein
MDSKIIYQIHFENDSITLLKAEKKEENQEKPSKPKKEKKSIKPEGIRFSEFAKIKIESEGKLVSEMYKQNLRVEFNADGDEFSINRDNISILQFTSMEGPVGLSGGTSKIASGEKKSFMLTFLSTIYISQVPLPKKEPFFHFKGMDSEYSAMKIDSLEQHQSDVQSDSDLKLKKKTKPDLDRKSKKDLALSPSAKKKKDNDIEEEDKKEKKEKKDKDYIKEKEEKKKEEKKKEEKNKVKENVKEKEKDKYRDTKNLKLRIALPVKHIQQNSPSSSEHESEREEPLVKLISIRNNGDNGDNGPLSVNSFVECWTQLESITSYN